MNLEELLKYVVTPAGMGAVTMLLVQLIQKFRPGIAGDVAYVVSVIVAVLVGIGAYYILPFLQTLDPAIAAVFYPVLSWAFNYLYHRFFTEHPA